MDKEDVLIYTQWNTAQPLKKRMKFFLLKNKRKRTTWIDLEGIMLSERSQTNTVCYYFYAESKK